MESRGAPEGLLQTLIGTLCLSIRLGVISRGEADGGTDALTESLPGLGGELRATVADDIHRETMKAVDVFHQQLPCLLGRRELRESHQVHSFGKTVYHREDNGVAHGGGKTGDEIQSDMRPRTTGDRKGVQETSRGLMG